MLVGAEGRDWGPAAAGPRRPRPAVSCPPSRRRQVARVKRRAETRGAGAVHTWPQAAAETRRRNAAAAAEAGQGCR